MAPSLGGPLSFLATAPRSSNFLGDMWGLRPALSQYGMTLSVVENVELFGNLAGGVRRSFEENGLTTATLQLDTQRAFGWNGGLFNVSGLAIYGGNISASNLYALQTASGIEATSAIRLWEAWCQQKLNDTFDIRIGEQSIDQEFMVSQNGGYFINTMMGWPMLPSANLPAGGPAYPLAGLGIRARAHLTDTVTLLAGLFNGSPVADNDGTDPQLNNHYGVSFPTGNGVLAIAELQFVYPGSGALVMANEADPLPLTYKLGFWYDSENFNDLQYDSAGVSLASPASSGVPARRRGNYAFYGVLDQMIWRSEDPGRNINVFIRPMVSPLQDRNLISFSVNAGLTMHEPILGRDGDTAGIGVGYARVGSGQSGYDRDLQVADPGVYAPAQTGETFLEATYQYQLMPSWQIQPDIQYIINPGGGIVNPNDPTQKIKNELVIGLRMNITL